MRAWKKVDALARQLLGEGSEDEDVLLYHLLAMFKLGRPPFADLRHEVSSGLASFREKGPSSPSPRLARALKLLEIELLQYPAGPEHECLDELGSFQRELDVVANGGEEEVLWWRRVVMSRVNTAVRMANWRVALVALEDLRRRPPLGAGRLAYEVEVHSRIGKVLLQMGDLEGAEVFLAKAQALDQEARRQLGDGNDEPKASDRVRLNLGLLAFAKDDLRTALTCFHEVIKSERRRQQSFTPGAIPGAISAEWPYSPEGEGHPTLGSCGLDMEDNLLIEAVNNLAICAMYTCELDQAVGALEALVREDPAAYMVDVVVFNLCTMYELSCDNEVATRRKRVLQQVAARFFLHDIAELSFRITGQ